MPDQSLTNLERFADALASMPPGTFLSHRSAAAVWGIWTPTNEVIEVTSAAGARGSRYTTSVQRSDIAAHRRLTPAEDVVEHLGLPLTSPGRTWLDLAALLSPLDLIAAGDSALRAGATPDELADRAVRAHRLRGAVRARQVVRLLDERSRSRPESRIRGALVLAGLPKPEVNEAIHDSHGQWLAEPDLAYREAKVALEYNGADHASLDRMRKDATRLLDLQRAGWTVRTYTHVDASRRLDEVVRDVRSLLLRAAPQLLTCRLRATG